MAGDRQQASRAFGEIRRIVEAGTELRGLFTLYKHSAEVRRPGRPARALRGGGAPSGVGSEPGLGPSSPSVPDGGCGTRMVVVVRVFAGGEVIHRRPYVLPLRSNRPSWASYDSKISLGIVLCHVLTTIVSLS